MKNSYVDIFFQEYEDIAIDLEKACLEFENSNSPSDCDAVFRYVHTLKGSSQTVGLTELGEFIHHFETALVDVKSGKTVASIEFMKALFDCLSVIELWVSALKEGHDEKPQEAIASALAQLERGLATASENNSAAPQSVPKVKPETKSKVEGKKDADEAIRISTKKIDKLLQLVGEISSQISIVKHQTEAPNPCNEKKLQALFFANRISKELREQTLSLRMQPVMNLFQKMERVARDVARKIDKNIKVTFSGEDVELDKTVIDYIKDPLLHIIRNAIDHGVEHPDERVKNNKPPQGKIMISAENHANGVNLHIRDDGRGLDTKRIKEKAIEKGLIEPDSDIPDEQLFHLIMKPGFSTASEVTDISGRGVGMDVVRAAINECSGDIHIDSTKGKGTEFKVFIPSTVSILDALIIDVNGLLYAVPVQDVSEIIDRSQYKISVCTNKGKVLSLRHEVVPFKQISEFLPTASENQPSNRGKPNELYNFNAPALVVRRALAVLGEDDEQLDDCGLSS